ncbi:OLC1v1016293C1 [Oldenlandia corymbosa var. corymbosa]|uniref:OLC1v1016293C1 n=1 Tax=Oldenlandia corymbosa var. corymbosa TaxID=529605 RepID=A0AAV1E7E5_OLDCO|nr:OLC1v1016293C1 [Oldenlandia corymbosa var. corymbosa]
MGRPCNHAFGCCSFFVTTKDQDAKRWGILTIHGDADRETTFFEVKDDNAGFNLTGFQFVNAIERVPPLFLSYANHYVAHIEMGHFPGLGLGGERARGHQTL